MNAEPIQTDARSLRWRRAGSLAALFLGFSFLIMGISFLLSLILPGLKDGWFRNLYGNWLILLFEVHSGVASLEDILARLNITLDLILMFVYGVMILALFVLIRRAGRILAAVAVVQPPLGMAVVLATGSAGRCAVMGAGLAMSIVMLRSRKFPAVAAFVGVLANLLLFAGDLLTSGGTSPLVAAGIAAGYVLITLWFFLIYAGLKTPDKPTA